MRQLRKARGADAACAACVLILVLVAFAPSLTGRTFTTVAAHQTVVEPWAGATEFRDVVQSDQADQYHPWRLLAERAAAAGSMAYWDDTSMPGGYPIATNGLSVPWYPGNLLLAATTDAKTAHEIHTAVHLALGGWFAHRLLRRFGLSRLASLLGGTAWAFGAFTAGWAQFDPIVTIVTWLPAGFLAARVRRDQPGGASALWLALAYGMTLLGMQLAFAAVTVGIVATADAVWQATGVVGRTTPWRSMPRALAGSVIALAAGIGLAGIGLVPTLVNAGSAGRRLADADDVAGLLPTASDLLHLVWPVNGPLDKADMNQRLMGAGTVVALLAVVALFRWRRGIVGFGAALTVGPLLFVIPAVARSAVDLVPSVGAMFPFGRLLVITQLGLAVLGAAGLDDLRARRSGSMSLRAVTALAVPVTAVQLLVMWFAVNTFASADEHFYPATPLTAAAAASGERFLPVVATHREPYTPPLLFGNEHVAVGVRSAGGYDSLVPRRVATIVRLLSGAALEVAPRATRGGLITRYRADQLRYDLLARFGVGGLLVPPGVVADATWGGPARLALAGDVVHLDADGVLIDLAADSGPWIVGSLRVVDPAAELATFVSPDFDPARVAVVTEHERARLDDDQIPRPGASGAVASVGRSVNRLMLEVDADGPALLVVPESWSEGWSATVDGRAVPVLRVDFNHRGVPIGPGASTVRFAFEPPGLVQGAAGTAASAIGCVGWFLVRTAPRRTGRRHQR